MASNNNIFYATNPARMADALWYLMGAGADNISDMLIFLPSRRAVRVVEQMIAKNMSGACILPTLVALGEAADEEGEDTAPADAVSNMARVITLSRLLAADSNVGSYSAALPIAHDLVRMWDYLENEGVDAAAIDWDALVDDKYATHFQGKARILNILSRLMPDFFAHRPTVAAARNRDIRAWRDKLTKYSRVIVCASTASVPATADLMVAVAQCSHGRILLSGKIDGNPDDFALDTNPYHSEYKLLQRLGFNPKDITPIDVGPSAIDFLNATFGNDGAMPSGADTVSHCHLIECARESEEAAVVAEIAVRAVHENKSVLVITPDAAGNQRIAGALKSRGVVADFSGGISGAMTTAGRAILNRFDAWIESGDNGPFDALYMESDFDLMETIIRMVDGKTDTFSPAIDLSNNDEIEIWTALREMSECIRAADIKLTLSDARVFVADALAGVSIRPAPVAAAHVCVLGTIESRMQTADIVILTGLNDGMFPARGYENAWLPLRVAQQIGLPSPNHKVSLQSLDFMNLSCGVDVYWTRSKISGGVQMTESRFLSRLRARRGAFDEGLAADVLSSVRSVDNPVPNPLDYTAPMPGPDWSQVSVTRLETLIHNPYAFYVQHILKLEPRDDYWVGADARNFGNLVHATIECAVDWSVPALISDMQRRASDELHGASGIIYQFWCQRFAEIAPVVSDVFSHRARGYPECDGRVTIAGRPVHARADRIWDGIVMDIKTGTPPNKSQLTHGTMPQLPLSAHILSSGGFPISITEKSKTPIIEILKLKKGDVELIRYDNPELLSEMVNNTLEKVSYLIARYSPGDTPYEYRDQTEAKYRRYDDLARCDD